MAERAADNELSPRMTRLILVVAVVVAATPHFFFPPPLQMHMQGLFDGWFGISIWAPAILAGVAFFFGVAFDQRFEDTAERIDPTERTAFVVFLVLAYVVFAGAHNTAYWAGMQGSHPWDELATALPLYAGLRALEVLFWQGFAQHRVFGESTVSARIAVVPLLGAAIYLPFALAGDPTVVLGHMMPLLLAESLIAALAFDIGFSLRTVMVVRAICGAAFIWFFQLYLL